MKKVTLNHTHAKLTVPDHDFEIEAGSPQEVSNELAEHLEKLELPITITDPSDEDAEGDESDESDESEND